MLTPDQVVQKTLSRVKHKTENAVNGVNKMKKIARILGCPGQMP